jgi:hypothetical protein
VAGPDGACLTVGIQGCAAVFLEDDGLCHPSVSKCPAGTIPRFAQGCVPVGIPKCAAAFLEADGLCHPAMSKCPAGTFAVPQEGCVPLDGPDGCGDAPWGHLAGLADTVYVDPGAPPGGAGDEQGPVTSIAAALALVNEGGRVALAAGTYGEPVHLTKPVTLEGRCPSLVRVQGLQKVGDHWTVAWVDSAAGVTLRGLELGGAGVGLRADDAAGLTLDRVHVRNADTLGIQLSGAGTDAQLTHVWVEGTSVADFMFEVGFGVSVEAGARAAVTGSVVFANHDFGFGAFDPGTEVTVSNSLVEGTLPRADDGHDGWGIDASTGARLTFTASAARGNRELGFAISDPGTVVTVSDSLVEGTLSSAYDQTAGKGLEVSSGARLALSGSAILGNRVEGVAVFDAAADGTPILTATGNLIAGTLPEESTQSVAFGLTVNDGAGAVLRDNAIVGSAGGGVAVTGQGIDGNSQVTLQGNLIEGTRSAALHRVLGRGLHVGEGAQVVMEGNALVQNRQIALGVFDPFAWGTRLTSLHDLVAGTLAQESDGQDGFGVVCGAGSVVSLSGALIRGNRVAGVLVEGAHASVERSLVDAVLAGSFTLGDAATTSTGVGDGLLATQGAQLDVSGSRVQGCARAGLLFDDSTGAVKGTVVTGNPYGLVLQGKQAPSYADGGNRISGNTVRDVVGGGDLPIPTAPAPVPPL